MFSRLTRKLCQPAAHDPRFGPDGTNWAEIARYTGQHMSGQDNRGIPGTQQWPAEQPAVGFANEELLRVDPNWRPR